MNIFEQKGYAYIKHLSTGGESEVHLIERDGCLYIAKVFNKMDELSCARLSHIMTIDAPNVPKMVEIFNYEDRTILIRQYIEGHTLYDEIQKNKTIGFERAKYIILKICETIRFFHNLEPNPIIHRDLKPDNILISEEDDVFLIDFGISRYYKEEVTRDTVLAGTKGYTAPEVLAGMQSDNRSDIYSIGLIFYEMLTGKNLLEPPYQIRPIKESNTLIPSWMDHIIEKATGLSMVNRYKSIDEFVDNIQKPKRDKRKKWIVIAIGFVIVASLLSVFGYKIYQNMEEQKDRDISIAEQSEAAGVEPYQVLLDLQFDDKEDASWFEIHGENAEEIIAEDCIEDGVFTLKGQIQLKQALQQGKFIHFQVIAPDFNIEGPMFMLDLVNQNWTMESDFQMFRFYFEHNRTLSLGVNKLMSFAKVDQKDTAMLMKGNMKVDVVVWLDEQDNSLRYIIFDTENENNIGYVGVVMEDGWQNESWFLHIELDSGFWGGAVSDEELYTDVVFLTVGSGSLFSYMSENIATYPANEERIASLMTSDIPNMNDLWYWGYDE